MVKFTIHNSRLAADYVVAARAADRACAQMTEARRSMLALLPADILADPQNVEFVTPNGHRVVIHVRAPLVWDLEIIEPKE